MTLTKKDINALKSCDSLTLSLTDNERSYITCIKKIEIANPWENDSKSHLILVNTRTQNNNISAKCHIENSNYNLVWQTVLDNLKENDIVTLHWYSDAHTNGYMEKAGLHGDALYLMIDRTIRGKQKRHTYLLESSCTPNNDVRMIKTKNVNRNVS